MAHPTLETMARSRPDRLTLERVAQCYENAIDLASETVEDCHLQTKKGRFAVTHTIATAYVLRPLLDHPLLFTAPVYETTGGSEENPHRVIDEIGQQLFYKLQARTPLPSGQVYVEENHEWIPFSGVEAGGVSLGVNIDTLDGTSNILTGHRDQASAVMLTDLQRNRFFGGSIVSLVDDALMTIEPGDSKLFQLRERYHRALQKEFKQVQPSRMRLATLGRHLGPLASFPFERGSHNPDLSTFGGYGLYKVATGSITTMFDLPGQIWYEAAMWGLMAEQMGLEVSDFQNRHYDWYQILRDSQQPGYDQRIPIVISHNAYWHYQFLDRFEQWQKDNLRSASVIHASGN